MNPLNFILAPARRRRKRRPPEAPPASLVLIAATYDAANARVELSFQYAVDASKFDGSQVWVEVPAGRLARRWSALGAVTPVGSAGLRVGLVDTGSTRASGTRLLASATNGLLVLGGAGTWAGASNLSLPFSS